MRSSMSAVAGQAQGGAAQTSRDQPQGTGRPARGARPAHGHLNPTSACNTVGSKYVHPISG
jgi:hypothetical protein